MHTGDVISDIDAGPPTTKQLKTLIVGVGPGSIGAAYQSWLSTNNGDVYSPGLASLDVTNDATLHSYISKAGPFDRILYAAGYNHLCWIEDVNKMAFDKHMDINVWGFIDVYRAHHYYFPEAKLKMVVLVSDAAETPMRSSLAYCTSKAAALMAMRCLARECSDFLRIVAVSPGVVSRTGMTEAVDKQVQELRGWTAEEAYAYENKGASITGRVTKAEVCETIQFAFDGPRHLHGTNIKVNGGR